MKVKRQKKVRQFLGFYKENFGLKAPYTVLVDGTFCHRALAAKVNIAEQLPKYLEAEGEATALETTPCVLAELDALGPPLRGALHIARQMALRACGHTERAVVASRCLRSMVKDGNPNHFMIATQDPLLSTKIRERPGTPLLYLKQSAIVLERPSRAQEQSAARLLQDRLVPTEAQKEHLTRLKESLGLGADAQEKKKRKRLQGANPLSTLKRKRRPRQSRRQSRRNSRHKRVNIPAHVRQIFAGCRIVLPDRLFQEKRKKELSTGRLSGNIVLNRALV